jgi:stress response protein YsnF
LIAKALRKGVNAILERVGFDRAVERGGIGQALEREPITDANRGDALDGPAISEEEHEVVLREERPVVDTEAVAVERIRLDTDTVREQETVSGEVRKEVVDIDDARADRTANDTDRNGH